MQFVNGIWRNYQYMFDGKKCHQNAIQLLIDSVRSSGTIFHLGYHLGEGR